jgi:ribosomal protein S18 acetylase RimI-like enzyme
VIDLREESSADLREHAAIPSVFESRTLFDVRSTPHGFELVERALHKPLRKNYDHFENPLSWSRELSATPSILIAAFSRGRRVGGIIVAVATPGLVTWANGPGTAILWDLRVAPTHRRQSVATSLLAAAQAWATQRGCRELDVETQNTNPAACKFYMRNSFVLQQARHGVYPEFPQDVQLIWRKRRDG